MVVEVGGLLDPAVCGPRPRRFPLRYQTTLLARPTRPAARQTPSPVLMIVCEWGGVGRRQVRRRRLRGLIEKCLVVGRGGRSGEGR